MRRLTAVAAAAACSVFAAQALADGFIGMNQFSGNENLITFNSTDMTQLSHPTANIGSGIFVTDSGGGTGNGAWRGNTDWSAYFSNIPGSSQGRALADSWGASDLKFDFTGAGNPNRVGLLLSTFPATTWTVRVYDPANNLVATTNVTMPGQQQAVFVGYERTAGVGYLRISDVENGYITLMDDLRFENFSGCNIDQNQPNDPSYMAAFSQTDLAQSFQHQNSTNICGAGIKLRQNIGNCDTVRISLWDRLPNQGGTMLATGSAQGCQGQWVDVFWNRVAIAQNTTYYLVFDGNVTLGISGDTANPYPHGQVYANSGFQSFPNFDYTFRTYSDSGSGPRISTYDIRDAARSGFGNWAHTYNGTIVDTGNFSANGFNFTRANYTGGSGTLNDGSQGTGPGDTQLFANNNDARPRITLHLNGNHFIDDITLYSFDSGNTIPGRIRSVDVTIGGLTGTFATTEPTTNDELIDLSNSILGTIPTNTIVLSNFTHDGGNSLNEMFCIGEIGLNGTATTRFGLTVTGTCPGNVNVNWSSAQPNVTLALIFSFNTGNFVIPFGPCQGTVLGLGGSNIRLVRTFNSGPGSGTLISNAPPIACGRYLQMHDLPACDLSNVFRIP